MQPAICKAIRNDNDLQTMKILAIAGHLGPSECQALMHKGFDDFIEDASDVAEVIKTSRASHRNHLLNIQMWHCLCRVAKLPNCHAADVV